MTLYKANKQECAFFVETLSKSLFNPTVEIYPSEMLEFANNLLNLTKRKAARNFILNWEPIYETLEGLFVAKTRIVYQMNKKVFSELQSVIPKLALRLRKYFPPESSMQIYQHMRNYFNRESGKENRYFIYLHLLLRTDYEILPQYYEYWMKELFALWSISSSSKTINVVCLSLFAGLARWHTEINWEPYLPTIVSRVVAVVNEFGFESSTGNSGGLLSLENNLWGEAITWSAVLVIGLLKPANSLAEQSNNKCNLL